MTGLKFGICPTEGGPLTPGEVTLAARIEAAYQALENG